MFHLGTIYMIYGIYNMNQLTNFLLKRSIEFGLNSMFLICDLDWL